MYILFAAFHPVDPQIVSHTATQLQLNGHKILFVVVEKEGIICDIVKSYGFKLKKIGRAKKSIIGKIFNVLIIDFRLFKTCLLFKPDIIFSPASPYTGHVSKLLKIKHICWGDTETATVNLKSSLPFIDSLLLPDCFYREVKSDKVIFFKSYKEIAYLHPNFFKPDSIVLDQLGIKESEKIILMRFSALHAMHDIGLKSEAITNEDLVLKFIQEIEKKYNAKVFISVTERNLDNRFEKYKLRITPEKYIHFLSFCSLYIGEGTTTASESGILGIPWIVLRPQALGYLIDQEQNYDLGIRTDDINVAFQKAEEYLSNDNIKAEWQVKREKLLTDKINFSNFLTWFIENYPESHKIMKDNPNYQDRFK